ncbi:MAG TPA: DNA polymerase III subunit gamma/tau [Anaerolineales bacterium]|jgi:DNA polymerase-3 subunit gamma/tau|nr:DNA polymerase III subunit gamma/tau [Anaerolineales bacterium]HQX15418.1 DNA polymerase III subunit gamma/tau [Anaerolineales bacterium]
MTQALYRKYRPQEWQAVLGQDHIVTTLRNAIAADRVAHAYLFAGSRGTGKTTLARLLAKAVNCTNPDPTKRPDNECENCKAVNENRFLDLIEIDAASNNGVEDVRDLRDKINFSPSQGKYKIYIVDEVHMLSTPAFNALLKTLEEPPPHAIFVLATTEIHKIPATVLSRCQRHEFRRVPVDEIVTNLKHIIQAENIQADDDALIQIARQSAGGMRDAQSLLDQLSSTGDKITLALAQTVLGTATSQTVLDTLTSIMDHDPARGLETIHKALDAGADPRSLARQIVEYLRGLMLIQMGNANQVEATADVKKQMQAHAKSFTTSDVLRMMKTFNNAAVDLRGGWQPSLSLELALAEVLDTPTESVSQITAPSQPKPKPAVLYQETESKPQAEKESASHPTEKSAVSAGDVIKAWKHMSSALPKSQANLSALMNSVRMIDVHGSTLILGLASDVLVSKIDKPDQIEAIQKLIKDEFGADVSVRCVVTNAKGKIPANVAQDGMVATAIQHGGEIVDTQD